MFEEQHSTSVQQSSYCPSIRLHHSTGLLGHHQSHQLSMQLLDLLHVLCLIGLVLQTLEEQKSPEVKSDRSQVGLRTDRLRKATYHSIICDFHTEVPVAVAVFQHNSDLHTETKPFTTIIFTALTVAV